MILAAALLILAGLGLFVAGIVTGVTVLYWACVAACVVAGVLLLVTWRRMPRQTAPGASGCGQPAPAREKVEARTAEEPRGRRRAGRRRGSRAGRAAERPDPGIEEVEVTDLLVVVDLKDEVLVVDEHPRYHVAGCSWLGGRETIPLPLDEARTDGFTPCAVCSPDRTLAERARQRKSAAGS